MLVPPFHPDPDWAESLAENLLQPTFSVSIWEALGRRLRRNYLWIFLILALAWVARVWLQPVPAGSWSEFVDRAAVGQIPGGVVVTVGAVYSLMLVGVGVLTLGMQKATGEVLPRFGHHEGAGLGAGGASGGGGRVPAWFRPHRRRSQLIALVVTTRAEQVADAIMGEMNRGVTALHGRGMYSRGERCVLLCAITVTEVAQVKSLVVREDPGAFVIVAPAQEVLGEGFAPL